MHKDLLEPSIFGYASVKDCAHNMCHIRGKEKGLTYPVQARRNSPPPLLSFTQGIFVTGSPRPSGVVTASAVGSAFTTFMVNFIPWNVAIVSVRATPGIQ